MTQSRRSFLKTTAAAVVGATLFDVRELLAAPPHTRLDVGGLSGSSPTLVSYAKAVKAMQALPTTNPLSWSYQAAIHGAMLSGSYPAWNTCEHGTHFFWSWHRMYLYWFERIIRKMSKNPHWALPYWNYESASERHLPAPFRVTSSPLYTSNRGPGWNAGTASLAPSAVATSGFMPTIPYFNAQSSCEGTPHAAVHVSISGWMGSVPTAAQDPIFFLHHANIDRLWNLWLKQGGGRTDPLTDGPWTTTKFLFFDETGAQKWMTSCDILRAQEQLNYDYQGEGTEVKEYCKKPLPWWVYEKEILLEVPPFRLPPGPDPGPVEVDLGQVRETLLRAATDRATAVTLELDGVEADKQPSVYWEVYVNLPKGAIANAESANYVGNVALFGHGIHDEHQHGGFAPAGFSFDLDRALKSAPVGEKVSLAFVACGAVVKGRRSARNEATVSIAKASLAVRRLKKT